MSPPPPPYCSPASPRPRPGPGFSVSSQCGPSTNCAQRHSPPSLPPSPGLCLVRPARPGADLRAAALAAKPPAEPGSFRKSDLVDLAALDPHIKLDIRYATSDNFLSTPVYPSADR